MPVQTRSMTRRNNLIEPLPPRGKLVFLDEKKQQQVINPILNYIAIFILTIMIAILGVLLVERTIILFNQGIIYYFPNIHPILFVFLMMGYVSFSTALLLTITLRPLESILL